MVYKTFLPQSVAQLAAQKSAASTFPEETRAAVVAQASLAAGAQGHSPVQVAHEKPILSHLKGTLTQKTKC